MKTVKKRNDQNINNSNKNNSSFSEISSLSEHTTKNSLGEQATHSETENDGSCARLPGGVGVAYQYSMESKTSGNTLVYRHAEDVAFDVTDALLSLKHACNQNCNNTNPPPPPPHIL